MRIDKFLKVSRLIKRRSVANEACGQGRVLLNDKTVKAGTEVKAGDQIVLRFGEREMRVQVLNIADHVAKADASAMYKVIK